MKTVNKFLLLITIIFANILQADIHEGKELFNEAKCMDCHNEEDFAVREKKVNSLKKLTNSVSQCEFNRNVGWFDEEVRDVAHFLNKKYYGFKGTNN